MHGFIFGDGTLNLAATPLEYWDPDRIRALLEAFGSGTVWLYNHENGLYDNISLDIPAGNWFRSAAGEEILVFDWSAPSNCKEAGQAEAAADALFASLVRRGTVSPAECRSRPLHFIGHSRGTSVVSETVQRLARYGIPVAYVTYLDPHDFGQLHIPRDEEFHDPAAQVWENVCYADNFWQRKEHNCSLENPAGRPLVHIPANGDNPAGGENYALTAVFLDCNRGDVLGAVRPHTLVIDYYWGTIALGSRPANWYPGNPSGAGRAFDRWLQGGGYDREPDPKLKRSDSRAARECELPPCVVPYTDLEIDENGASDPNTGEPPVLFNGDFELADLDLRIGAGERSLAGWFFHGGGGKAGVKTLNGQTFIELDADQRWARHNRFYLPPGTDTLEFDLWFVNVPLVGNHYLDISVGGAAGETSFVRIKSIPLIQEEDGFATTSCSISSSIPVHRLQFSLRSSTQVALPRVRIDNIRFSGGSVACRDPGGLQVPGDVNQDARFDISDAVTVLRFLFTGQPAKLPCGDGSPDDPGNILLIDSNGDGRIDISDGIGGLNWLFGSGQAHALAVPGAEIDGCVRIAGCPDTGGCL